MKKTFLSIIKNRRGISKLAVVLIILAIVLAAVIAIPVTISVLQKTSAIGCEQALDTARRQLYDAYQIGTIHNVEDAKNYVAYVMNGWDDICPDCGNIYIVKQDGNAEEPYRIFCGLHNADKKENTRYNAESVLDQVKAAVKKCQAEGNKYPDSVTVKLHNKDVVVTRVEKETNINYGTNSTPDVKGTVIYFGITGKFEYEKSEERDDSLICYFDFADEEYAAVWSIIEGWHGSSYR